MKKSVEFLYVSIVPIEIVLLFLSQVSIYFIYSLIVFLLVSWAILFEEIMKKNRIIRSMEYKLILYKDKYDDWDIEKNHRWYHEQNH